MCDLCVSGITDGCGLPCPFGDLYPLGLDETRPIESVVKNL
jgi:hypothetical protein